MGREFDRRVFLKSTFAFGLSLFLSPQGQNGQIRAQESCPPDPSKLLLVNAPKEANFRDAPNMDGEVLETLQRNAEVEELGRDGEWIRVRDLDCEEGYVHQSLLEREDAVDMGYTELVFARCPYQNTTITNMVLLTPEVEPLMIKFSGEHLPKIPPEEIIDNLYFLQGRNVFEDYGTPNPLGIPLDKELIAILKFTLGYNSISDIYNDPISILLFTSASSGEAYVFGQVSSEESCDGNGNHCGNFHGCTDSAIPLSSMNEIFSYFN